MVEEEKDLFPLSRTKSVKGTRRLAREKVLQILVAYRISEGSPEEYFKHIFHRKFNFADEDEEITRLLTPDEIYEIEADVPIAWKNEDVKFGLDLINETLGHTAEFDRMIDEHADNWELERIALIDRILMHMALAELLYFEDIPIKVSVNEAIDIAKKYSTDKSSVFINGVLDSLLGKLQIESAIKKTGRGLKES
jgi:N utilization substance protein B